MGTNPQDALNRLIAALEAHAQAARSANLSGAEDTGVLEAVEERLRDAFFTYDDVLFNHYGIDLPFEMLGDPDDDFEDYEDSEDFDDFEEDDDFEDFDEDFEEDFDEDEASEGVYYFDEDDSEENDELK